MESPPYHEHHHSHEHTSHFHMHGKAKQSTHEMDAVDEPMAFISGDSLDGGNNSFMNGPTNHWHFASVSVISMVVGFILAFVTLRRRSNSNHPTYERVPNAMSLTL